MIQAALMSIPICESNWEYKITIQFESGISTYFIDNPDDIPVEMRRQMDTGDLLAGVFEFEPDDQFARYIPQKVLQASWDANLDLQIWDDGML